jgi:hypothetical protein
MLEREVKTVNPVGNPRIRPITPGGDYEKTPFENFEGLAAKLLKVPKEEVDEKRAEQKKARKQD